MKTEIEHCKHFDPKTFILSDGCSRRPEMVANIHDHYSKEFNSVWILSQCMNVNRKKCPYYED